MKCIPAQTSAASKPEMQAGSQSSDLIVLDKLSAMDLSGQIHLYLQLFQYPVAMRSVLQLDVMWSRCFHLCVLNPLSNNFIRCLLVPGLWAIVVNLSRLGSLWPKVTAKLNFPYMLHLPSFFQAEAWPLSSHLCGAIHYLGTAMSFLFQCFLLWGEKKIAELCDVHYTGTLSSNRICHNAGIFLFSFSFQILYLCFWFLLTTELMFSENNAQQP